MAFFLTLPLRHLSKLLATCSLLPNKMHPEQADQSSFKGDKNDSALGSIISV